MLLSRDYVTYMSKEVVKRLVAGKMIETKNGDGVTQQVRQVISPKLHAFKKHCILPYAAL